MVVDVVERAGDLVEDRRDKAAGKSLFAFSRLDELVEVALHGLKDEIELEGGREDKAVVEGDDVGVVRDGAERLENECETSGSRETSARTSISLSVLHSSQPPSHWRFMRLSATRRRPAHSGRTRGLHCMGERGVLGGRSECQSQSHTVPNEPSPTFLRVVQERWEPARSVSRRQAR